jgi:putative ABC transport system permease protein
VASSMDAMLSRQIRDIGVMKAVGATRRNVAALYGTSVLLLGAAATAVAMGPAAFLARKSATMIGGRLNLSLETLQIPHWVFVVLWVAGTLVPLFAALIPIRRVARSTVRQAMDGGGSPGAAKPTEISRLNRWATALGLSRPMLLGLRNVGRRRYRLALTVALLAAGGGVFTMSSNIVRGWDRSLARIIAARRYQILVRCSTAPGPEVLRALARVSGVTKVECIATGPAAVTGEDELGVDHAYPDHGHGSSFLAGVAPDTTLLQLPIQEGRWLRGGDDDAIVLTPHGRRNFPQAQVGDRIRLSVLGKTSMWTIVGRVEEFGPAPMGYVTSEAFARFVRPDHAPSELWIATSAAGTETVSAVARLLDETGTPVEMIMPTETLRSILGDHLQILFGAFTVMALVMAGAGAIALSSTINIEVLQRTREFGVLKAIGATPGQIRRMIMSEGLLVGLMGAAGAFVLGVVLTVAVGRALGAFAFGAPLFVLISPGPALAWSVLTIGLSVAASVLPARRAARLTVREALIAE